MTEETPKQEASTSVYDVLAYAYNLFVSFAWQAMGFVPDPATGKIRTSLEEAKIAIDCADFLAGKWQSHAEPETQKEIERVLRDLKVNFVAKSTEASKET